MGDEIDEPILKRNPHRYAFVPSVEHKDIMDLLCELKKHNWQADEIDFSQDSIDMETKLNDNEKHFIKMITAFFASSDGIVMENIDVNFSNEIQIPEARLFFAFQAYNESEHSITYSMMIQALVKDREEQTRLFHAITEIPAVQKLTNWVIQWMDNRHPFCVRLLAFILYEGLIFSDKFAAIFWFKQRKVLPGVSQGNRLISIDEGAHETHGILLWKKLKRVCSEATVHQMVREVVELDTEFMIEAIPVTLIGMNVDLMSDYIKLVANRLLKRLGCSELYTVVSKDNALMDIMNQIGLDDKVSFFEFRNHVYSKLDKPKTFSMDADF
jgi:ribonucleoside-diphosphate reductase beta chain